MVQVEINSHFWTNLEMLKKDIELYDSGITGISLKDYLMVGIDNCIKQGFSLNKKKHK
jgi:hypothetical protein